MVNALREGKLLNLSDCGVFTGSIDSAYLGRKLHDLSVIHGLDVKACLHRAFAFTFFCIIQCRQHFHPSLVSMGDANTNACCKWAFRQHLYLQFLQNFVLLQLFCDRFSNWVQYPFFSQNNRKRLEKSEV